VIYESDGGSVVQRSSVIPVPDFRIALGLALAIAVLLFWSVPANAQAADDQYAEPVSPSGPAAGLAVTVEDNDGNGIISPGDVIIIPGEYDVADGASVTLQDADGTQGTLIDDVNAVITKGSVVIEVTDWPIINVPGENGVLDIEGLFVVATTGISAEDDAVAPTPAGDDVASGGVSDAAPEGVLPDTGGIVSLSLLGTLMLVGTGLLIARNRMNSR
jgi:LPXTG-motif cell wall-anchored protein